MGLFLEIKFLNLCIKVTCENYGFNSCFINILTLRVSKKILTDYFIINILTLRVSKS